MANPGTPNTNGSQFFMTVGECQWLDKKHTVFGKIEGSTIFNLLKISEVETEDDKPIGDLIP
jgi:peptidyl-prolyl cis-trans isomerase SDCCAG10